jgi:5'-nucleotidase
MTQPTALLTNDDGIESSFLLVLADALADAGFALTVIAPAAEQSWIGRAMSRRRPIAVDPWQHGRHRGFKVDGTPSDCVNLAFGHLLSAPPSIVVSGINIGFNASIPIIYSSGTVSGALEGAWWGCHAIAVSQQVPDASFEEITHNKHQLPASMADDLRRSAAHAAAYAWHQCQQPAPAAGEFLVHNLNYPFPHPVGAPCLATRPAMMRPASYYHRDADGRFHFGYADSGLLDADFLTECAALRDGAVSCSILNFSRL